MTFSKEDLLRQDYSWPEDESIYNGTPSRRVFNRYNGYQVLFVINALIRTDLPAVDQGRKIEELITSSLPLDAKSEISVLNWIRINAD